MKSSKKLHKQQIRSQQKRIKKEQERDKQLKIKMQKENKKQLVEQSSKLINNTTDIVEQKPEPRGPQDFEESTTFIPNTLGEIFLNSAYLYGSFFDTPKKQEPTKHEKIKDVCNKSQAKKEKDETIIDAEFIEIEK